LISKVLLGLLLFVLANAIGLCILMCSFIISSLIDMTVGTSLILNLWEPVLLNSGYLTMYFAVWAGVLFSIFMVILLELFYKGLKIAVKSF